DPFIAAQAMILSREGVVGAWSQPTVTPENYIGNPDCLDRWSTPVRIRILRAELLSGIYYDCAENSVAVEYRSREQSNLQTLVHLIRPHPADFVQQLSFVSNYAALRMERSS